MSIIAQACLCLFPLMIMLIVYIDNRKHQIISAGDRSFDKLVIISFLSIVTYFFSQIPSSWTFEGAAYFRRSLICLHLIVSGGIGVMQVRYTLNRVNPTQKKIFGINKYTLHIPIAVCTVLSIASCFTNIVFFITDNNEYVFGEFVWVPCACNAVYLLVCMLLCISSWVSTVSAEVKSDCKMVFGACAFAAFGVALQLVYIKEEIWISLPVTTLAVFFVYMSVQNDRITIDSLTGLNNRRELVRLLEHRMHHRELFTVMMIDLNGLKKINDTYGHLAGDEALRRFADVLRKTLSRAGYFFSRCGGDEFAFILPTHTEEDAETFIGELRAAVNASNALAHNEYNLEFSAGYAIRNTNTACDWHELYDHADKHMYERKLIDKGIQIPQKKQGGREQ